MHKPNNGFAIKIVANESGPVFIKRFANRYEALIHLTLYEQEHEEYHIVSTSELRPQLMQFVLEGRCILTINVTVSPAEKIAAQKLRKSSLVSFGLTKTSGYTHLNGPNKKAMELPELLKYLKAHMSDFYTAPVSQETAEDTKGDEMDNE